jgi:hypothetical protein
LTLRTLLAYLDDTLEPAQAKLIGQKVAESDAAQELIARIKQVTRRRRLTTPPAGPGAKTDPNMIAEYLDNTLQGEQLGEIEEICLASDVHLAEIASCHQILTLVLGEPALVPPTARQRMYGLIKGPEAIPFRRPTAGRDHAGDSPADEAQEVDETLRLGLPAYRRQGGWTQRLAIAGGVLALVAVLALAIWQNLRPSRPAAEHAERAAADTGGTERGTKARPAAARDTARRSRPAGKSLKDRRRTDKARGKGVLAGGNRADKGDGEREDSDGSRTDKDSGDRAVGGREDAETSAPNQPIPKAEPRLVAHYAPPGTNEPRSILLRRGRDESDWLRLGGKNLDVRTSDRLVSLPGYHSEVRFDNGLRVIMWGDLPELSLNSPLLESVVTLHEPLKFDLDLTLDRGRFLIANNKGKNAKARVRVRFDNPSSNRGTDYWEITLEDGAELSVELFGRYPTGVPFDLNKNTRQGPDSELYLVMLKGQADVKVDYNHYSLEEAPGAGLLSWNSREGTKPPVKIPRAPDWAPPRRYSQFPPGLSKREEEYYKRLQDDMLVALKEFSTIMSGKKADVGLLNALGANDVLKRILAVRSFGAIDDLDRLLDGLEDLGGVVREATIADLRHWIGLHWQNDLVLYDALRKKHYSKGEAHTIMELLHSFSDKERGHPETYETLIGYLRQSNKPIRALAYWHLVRLVPWGRAIPYDPMGDSQQVERAYQEWKKLVPDGKLPKPPSGGREQPKRKRS